MSLTLINITANVWYKDVCKEPNSGCQYKISKTAHFQPTVISQPRSSPIQSNLEPFTEQVLELGVTVVVDKKKKKLQYKNTKDKNK